MHTSNRMHAASGCGKRRAWARSGAVSAGAIGLILIANLLSAAQPSGAEDTHADEHLHTPLEVSAELGWSELIDATLENFPSFVELAARDQEATALSDRGRSWLSGAPQLVMRYQTDRYWDNANLLETELGVELPLWRPGERRAAEALGHAATDGASAAGQAMRHEVIGLLRLTLWDIERAANELAVAEDGARVARELLAVVERRYEAGEAPLADTLLVESTALEREARVIEAEALLVDAERGYQSLTGLTVRPAEFAEPLTARADFDDSHPALILADADIDRARAELDLTRRSARGAPTLSVGPLEQRGAFSDYSARSLNLEVSMPIGGRSHAAAATSAVQRELAQAESERRKLVRELELELHEAQHTLLVIDESLELAGQRSTLAARSFAMSEQAFLEGEITLLELLRSEETALLTQREVTRLEVARQRAIAEINQAIGVWP